MSTLFSFLLANLFSTTAENVETLPLAVELAEQTNDLDVVVISDLNGSYGSLEYGKRVHFAVQKIITEKPDVVLITGDMVAGQKPNLNYRGMWRSFHRAVTKPLHEAGIPVMVTPGNHDASAYKKYANERRIFAKEWIKYKPDVEYIDDTHYPYRYAFMMEDTLFVSLDDTRAGSLGAEQELWLDEILATDAENKVVYGHLPLYPFAKKKVNEVIGDPYVEQLFNKHGVDIFISGHHHAYYPGQRGNLQLLSTPCLGSGARQLINSERSPSRGYVSFTIHNGELEELEAWSGKGLSKPIDRKTLPFYVGTEEFQIWRDDLVLQHEKWHPSH